MKPKHPSKKDQRFLVLDTNVLWHPEKNVPVSPLFESFISKNRDAHNIKVFVPEVVFGELLFQQTSTAVDLLSKVNKNIHSLSEICSQKYKHRIADDRVKKDVERKLRGWFSANGLFLVETPVDAIDWKRIIHDAIWRNPPFEEDKDKKKEKGFRDALILETVLQLNQDNPEVQIDFVSHDRLLRESSDTRGKGTRIKSFESLEDLESHLKLLDQQLTEKFVSSITARAREKFFSPSGKQDLYDGEKVRSKIRESFPDKLSPPTPYSSGGNLSRLLGQSGSSWTSESEERIWISPSNFDGRDDYVYHWKNKISFIQFFKNEGAATGSLLTDYVSRNEVRIRKVIFQVSWHSNVSTDGRFSRIRISGIDYLETVFRVPTDDETNRYGLPATPE
jgi:hypothetical protein